MAAERRVIRVAKAWDLIGATGAFRLVGGHATYEGVAYNDSTRGSNVRLDRMVHSPYLHVTSRYIDPDTWLEVIDFIGSDEAWYAGCVHEWDGTYEEQVRIKTAMAGGA